MDIYIISKASNLSSLIQFLTLICSYFRENPIKSRFLGNFSHIFTHIFVQLCRMKLNKGSQESSLQLQHFPIISVNIYQCLIIEIQYFLWKFVKMGKVMCKFQTFVILEVSNEFLDIFYLFFKRLDCHLYHHSYLCTKFQVNPTKS